MSEMKQMDAATLEALNEIVAVCRREPKSDQSDEYLAAYYESHLEIILSLALVAIAKAEGR